MATTAAFLCLTCRTLRLPKIRYYCSQIVHQGVTATSSIPNGDGLVEEQPEIPMVPKRKDPHSVLKALASTVEPLTQELFHGIGAADPMYPQSKFLKMEYIKNREAGKSAAEYVMHHWPDLFKLKKLDKEPVVTDMKPLEKSISKKRPLKAMWIYNKMKENGEEVSLDTKNNLLALVAYYGLGSPWANKSDSDIFLRTYRDISWWPVGQIKNKTKTESDEIEVTASEEKLSKTRFDGGFKLWSKDSDAEKLFREMEDKNGDTYEALIQGLVKFQNIRRAFEIFDEMQSRGFQAHRETYNLLLSSLVDSATPDSWTKAKHILKLMSTEPVAQPNACTFNILLEVAAFEQSAVDISASIMREMFHLGVEPTLTTLYHLLKTNSSKGEALVIKDIINYLEQNMQVVLFQDTHCHQFFNQALFACKALRDRSLAMRLKRISEKSGNRGLIDNYITFASQYLIILCGRSAGAINNLMTEYRRIVPLELIPFEWLYGSMFKSCAEAGRVDIALEIWEDVLKYNVKIEKVDTVNRLCDVFKDVKCTVEESVKYTEVVEKAVDLLYKSNSMIPSAHVINTLIKLACVSRDIDKAWEFYDWYDRASIPPMFESLYTLLRAHYKSPNKESIIWILKKMIEQDMFLPEKYVLQLCAASNIDEDVSVELARKMERDAK